LSGQEKTKRTAKIINTNNKRFTLNLSKTGIIAGFFSVQPFGAFPFNLPLSAGGAASRDSRVYVRF